MKRLRITTKVVLFLVIFAVLFCSATEVLRNKEASILISSFYDEKKDSLDVVFLGTSQILMSVSPMQLWNDYGIASYNMGQHGQSFALTYYCMEEAIEKQHPKLVVVDVFYMMNQSKVVLTSNVHKTIDNLAWGLPKLEAIYDVGREQEAGSMVDYLLPMNAFHMRWKDLTESDFKTEKDYMKGGFLYYEQQSFGNISPIAESETMDVYPETLVYLNKMIALCKKTNTQLLLVKTPYYPVDGGELTVDVQYKMLNEIGAIAKENDVPYINGLYKVNDIGLNYSTDMYDWGHVNAYGAMKITDYLGNYIKQNYTIPDRREDSAYMSWNNQYVTYEKILTKHLKSMKVE